MASPITWRNVNGPDLTGAAAILGRSQENFQNMFSGLQNVMDTARNTQIANQENQVNLNTDRFEQMLRERYRTDEELQAARQSGELDALRQEFGPYGLNTERTNAAAIDSLISGMQKRQQNQWEFDSLKRDQQVTPVLQEYLSDINGLSADMNLRDRANYVQDAFARIDADTRLDEEGKNTAKSRIRNLVADQDNQFITRNNYFTDQKALADKKEAERLLLAETDSRFVQQREYDSAAKRGAETIAGILNLSPSQLADNELVADRVNSLSPEQFEAYQAAQSELLNLTDPTSGLGDRNQQIFRELADRVGFSAATEMFNAMEDRTTSLTDLSAVGRQRAAKVETDYEKQVRNNSFYKDAQYGQSPAEKVESLAKEMQASGKSEDMWWWNNNDAREAIMAAASGTYSLNGKDPVGEIPIGYLKTAILTMRPGAFNDTTFREALNSVLGSADIGKERKEYEEATKQRDTALARVRANDMGRMNGSAYINTVRGLPTSQQSIVTPEPVPTPEEDLEDTGDSSQRLSESTPLPGFLGVPAAEQQILAARQAREAERRVLQESINTAIVDTGNADQINRLSQQLETRSRSMGYDKRNEVRQELLKALPDVVFENPEASDYLDDIPKFMLDRELKRRGLR